MPLTADPPAPDPPAPDPPAPDPSAPLSSLPTADSAATVLVMALAADPGSLSVVRERLRRWLAALGWPPTELAEIVLAVNEAVSNTVKHAYPADHHGEVRVAARAFTDTTRARRVIIGISDDGRWRPARAGGPGGHGLPILHVCMDSVEIHRDPGGTTVLLTSVPLPPPQLGPGSVPARGPA